MVKFKARMVADGRTHIHDIDYDEVFCAQPLHRRCQDCVSRSGAGGSILLFHFDVTQACVRTELDPIPFMRSPAGCGSMSGRSVKSNRALYSLKQADRQWSTRLVHD